MKHRNKGHLGKFYSRGTINLAVLAVLITIDHGDHHETCDVVFGITP